MKVSLNWSKEFTDVRLPIGELVEKIGAQLGAVDEVIDLGKRYEGIIIVKVVTCEKHPGADKLTVCTVDDGGVVKDVERNGQGQVEIVCGAPNVTMGMLAAWIPPGVTVPNTLDKEPQVVVSREIRGAASHGMLASPKELALGDKHEELIVIDEEAKAGDSFAQIYKLNDHIIDIENKMFTHRPDCFGILGIAREIAGITQQPFKSPKWYLASPELRTESSEQLPLEVKNEVPELVPRFMAVALSGVKVKPSPLWIQARLSVSGIKPVNNVVDITNYLMLETGQPLHAYDYDKVKSGTLGVRQAKAGEELNLLGGKKLKLQEGAVVITDGEKPIGLGGVMGGAETEVSENTSNIILECANFNMNAIRAAAMAYGLFTDAAVRFTKGQSPLQNPAALARTIEKIKELTGGQVASDLKDEHQELGLMNSITVDGPFINRRLGLELNIGDMASYLRNVEFEVATDEILKIQPPFWRTDIEIPEDIVEEIGRLYGYDHVPLKLPLKDLSPAKPEQLLAFKTRLRNIVSSGGANEVLTYSFVHGSLLQKAGQDEAQAYHIRNALSPDLQHYRLSLTPSLLEKVHPNIKSGHNRFVLFEIGRAHVRDVLDKQKLPAEIERVALVVADSAPSKNSGAPFFAARRYCNYLLNQTLGISPVRWVELSDAANLSADWQEAGKAYEPKHSAAVYAGDELLGLVGEPTIKLQASLKLPAYVAQMELDLAAVARLEPLQARYYPLNRYPGLSQDLCLRAPSNISYQQLTDLVRGFLDARSSEHGYIYWLKALDVFQKQDDKEHKQTTWRITLFHRRRTLTTKEANQLLDDLSFKADQKLGAHRV